ncbi:MAG TPA: mechanosensitive ion channel family protein [Mucilaginibacter sp.]
MIKLTYGLVIWLNVFTVAGQQPIKTDSLHSDSLLLVVRQLSAERNADSLKRLSLEQQVGRLSEADNQKKYTLLRELNQLKSRDSLRMARQKRQVDSLRRFVKGHPVILLNDTLFLIYARQGSFTAAERAEAVQNRIKKLTTDQLFDQRKLSLSNSESNVDIVYHDELILSVSVTDALWQNLDKNELAKLYRKRIIDAISTYREETRWQTIAKEALLALLVIAFAAGLIISVIRTARWLQNRTQVIDSRWFKGIKIRNYELLDKSQQHRLLASLISVLKWVLLFIIFYVAIPIVFGIFPYTREISATLFGYIAAPLKKIGNSAWNYIPNLITIIIMMIVFRYVLRFFRFLKIEIEQEKLKLPGFYADWANPTYQIIRVLVLAFMLIVIFPYLPGSESPVFKGVSVFMGVLFTFGSAGALGNVVAGLVLTYMRAFKIGDRVQIGEVTGDVIQKTLLVTRIRTIKNEIISIPNSTVMNNHTVNFSSEAHQAGLILHTTVTIGYDAPWRQVHELLIAAAQATEKIEEEPVPFVLQTSLDDYYVSYQLNAYTRHPEQQAIIYSKLHSFIQDKFNEAGIEIMSPHYKAIRDGNAVAIPSDYLPQDYIAPVFQTRQRKD